MYDAICFGSTCVMTCRKRKELLGSVIFSAFPSRSGRAQGLLCTGGNLTYEVVTTVRKTHLPFARPTVGEEEVVAVADALRSGWLTSGPKVKEFEAAFALDIGAEAALAVSSCTAALHISLLAHGIGPEDEVITSTMTFAATANVVEHVGARPVLVDVEPDTLNIDPKKVEAALTNRTRAVIAVHYAGHPAELDALRKICQTRGIHLIEDAAHSLPASYRGRKIGSETNLAAFSFYATKNLTTGEGGMLTGPEELIDKVRPLALHGMSRDAWKRYDKGGNWYYEVAVPGFKYNMTDPDAAMGLVQLGRLKGFQARRRAIVNRYIGAFAGHPAFEMPIERAHVEHSWHLFPLRLKPYALVIDRNKFIEELARHNIGTSVHFIPVHRHPYYRDRYGYRAPDFPVAEDAFNRIMSLPLDPGLTDEDVDDVTNAVLGVANEYKR